MPTIIETAILGSLWKRSSVASSTTSPTQHCQDVIAVENESVASLRDVYNDISSWYDYFFGPALYAGRREAMSRLPLSRGDQVLEVGVGTGTNALLYRKDCRVTGIDFSAAMLERARGRIDAHGVRNVELHRMDAVSMDFEDDSFDVVYAPFVISAVSDPFAVLREMYRVCRPDGHVMVLNHFRSENAVVSLLERLISPLTVRIGFRSDLDLPGFLAHAGLEPISVDEVGIPKIWSLVAFRKGDEYPV